MSVSCAEHPSLLVSDTKNDVEDFLWGMGLLNPKQMHYTNKELNSQS